MLFINVATHRSTRQIETVKHGKRLLALRRLVVCATTSGTYHLCGRVANHVPITGAAWILNEFGRTHPKTEIGKRVSGTIIQKQ